MSQLQIQANGVITQGTDNVPDRLVSAVDINENAISQFSKDAAHVTKAVYEVAMEGDVNQTGTYGQCNVYATSKNADAVTQRANTQTLTMSSKLLEALTQDTTAKSNIAGSVTAFSKTSIDTNSFVSNMTGQSEEQLVTTGGMNAAGVTHSIEPLHVDVTTGNVMSQESACSVNTMTQQSTNTIHSTQESANMLVSPPDPSAVVTSSQDSTSVVTSPQTSPNNSVTSPVNTESRRRGEGSTGPRKRKRRGSAWSDEQTDFLMEIWARHTDPTKGPEDFNHNAPVYRIIARAMEETGSPKSWEQCKTRIHTLKRAYKLTKDEVLAGATDITYCRHFETLKIIMGDNESTTPQMLADLLETKRKERKNMPKSEQPTPQKRPKPSAKKTAKRVNTQELKPPTHNQNQTVQNAPQNPDSTVTSPTSYWYGQSQSQYDQGQVLQPSPQQQETVSVQYQYSGGQRAASLPPPPPYPALNNADNQPAVLTNPDLNNSDVMIKREQQDSMATQEHSISTMTSQTWPVPQPPQKEELEKMRLNLELRKIEMERNKLEYEERQRREERDHQYRMLQLLMFGLGQQNSAHQGAEQVVAHAQNSTNLSRALENGLVPGGPHSANEKGLSFNEI